MLTGAPISAERAAELGLVNRVTVGDPDPTARELAHCIAANAPLSLSSSLDLVGSAEALGEEACWEQNDCILRAIMESRDAREGARAFAEKRAPQWRGD